MPDRKAMWTIVSLALVVLAATLAIAVGAGRQDIPQAVTARPVAQIGALYPSAGAMEHGCTATVVDSRSADTLLTAAHCVVGRGAGMVFVPAERSGRAPFGRWLVTAAYVEPEWLVRQDPDADLAFLAVAPRLVDGVRRSLESVTGAFTLGSTPTSGDPVTITGYPAGTDDGPITCRTKVYVTRSFPSFDCRGFVAGTSGSPWLRRTSHGTQVVGVIGGLHQGGCFDYTSYSSPLTLDADLAYLRASDKDPADVAPRARGNGC